MIKKRENPQSPGNFAKICEICEEKYLNRIILDDFFKKKNKKDEETKVIEQKLTEIKQELAIKQNEYSKAQSQVNKKKYIFRKIDKSGRKTRKTTKRNFYF